MSPVDLVIRNGWVVSPHGRLLGGVAVDGERIVAVGPDAALPPAHRTIDAQEQFVIPGLIDPHVHLTSEEDASLAGGLAATLPALTRGMVHGGVTSFGHFAGAAGRALVPQLTETIAAIDAGSYADGFLHAFVMGRETLDEQEQAWALGVTSFKHFYTAYGRRRLEDPGLGDLFRPVDNDVLLPSMRWIASKGRPGVAMVHAEDGDVVDACSDEVFATGRTDLGAWSDARPAAAESLRVASAIALSDLTGAPLYVVHLTTAAGAALVAAARARGSAVVAETGPHWLTHHGGMEREIGCWGKVNPPLRTPADCDALWRALRTGAITCLGTDDGSGGRTRATKQRGGDRHGNVWAARPGVRGGSEHLLGVLMTFGVHAGRISMEDLVRLGSHEPARVFGVAPRKGALVPGADADIVVVDPDREVTVDESFYRSGCEVSVYDGWRLKGMARTTIVRGRVSVEDGETVTQPGHGRYLPRGVAR